MSRHLTRRRREILASQLLGVDVREVPKAALATVAVYLALRLDVGAGFEAARELLWREWAALIENGIVDAPVPVAVYLARKGRSSC